MIRKLDLFLSNHSRFPAKKILMKASCAKKGQKAKPRWNTVEETQLSGSEICFITNCKASILFLSLSRSQNTDGEISMVNTNREKRPGNWTTYCTEHYGFQARGEKKSC